MNNKRTGDIRLGWMFVVLGLVVTAVTYGVIFILALTILTLTHHAKNSTQWAHLASIVYLTASILTVLRTPENYWTQLKWDAKGPDDRLYPVDGYAWNLIPFGPQSSRSWIKVFASFLIFGPQFIITGIKDVTPIPHNGCRPRKRRRV